MLLLGLLVVAASVLTYRYYDTYRFRTRVKSGRAYLDKGDPASALHVLRSLIEEGRRDEELLHLVARCYRLTGIPERSLEYLSLAAELGFQSIELDQEQGLALFELGRFQEAEPILQSCTTKEAIAALTFLHFELFKMDQVLRDLGVWSRLDPENPTPHLVRGDVWVQAPDHGKACEAFRRALELDPTLFEARAKLGSSLHELGQLDEAAEILRKCLDDQPGDLMVMYLLARCESERGDVPAARSLLQGLLGRDANVPSALVELGKLDLADGEFESAANLLRRAVELEPHNDSALYNLAMALQRLGRQEDANEPLARWAEVQRLRRRLREMLDRIEADPTDLEAHTEAGSVCLELGDTAQASRHVSAVLARDPSNATARALVSRVAEQARNRQAAPASRPPPEGPQ